jgi:hypothetical protein
MAVQGSWFVQYKDGGELYQWMREHPAAVGGEVPFRMIDWARVSTVVFESQWVRSTFDFHGVPPGCRVKLMSRTMMSGGNSAVAFMIVTLRQEAPEPGTEQFKPEHDVLQMLFWYPDGSTHVCTDFQCPDASNYLASGLWGRAMVIAPRHAPKDESLITVS